ncbi:TIGR04222 domain-containing membrane protein [Actinomadura sp. RB99]|uniref:TIGR04222 domain-containing membrane protein n=1 Tax=Actinomadura sp. RB99 TaxID=2691577 RepID=UPI00321FF688
MRATPPRPTTGTASTRCRSRSNPPNDRNRGHAPRVLRTTTRPREAIMGEHGPYESEHGPYEIAFLTGGAVRVAQTALVALHEGRRVRVSRGTHRVQAVNREADDAVQAALLALVPGTGILLGDLLQGAAASEEVRAIGDALKEAGLVRGGLRGALRPTRAGRAARNRAVEDVPPDGPGRCAALGPDGVEDARLREILLTRDPKPLKLDQGRRQGHQNLESSNLSDNQYGL